MNHYLKNYILSAAAVTVITGGAYCLQNLESFVQSSYEYIFNSNTAIWSEVTSVALIGLVINQSHVNYLKTPLGDVMFGVLSYIPNYIFYKITSEVTNYALKELVHINETASNILSTLSGMAALTFYPTEATQTLMIKYITGMEQYLIIPIASTIMSYINDDTETRNSESWQIGRTSIIGKTIDLYPSHLTDSKSV